MAPTLLTTAAPGYPGGATSAAGVELELTIDESGHVTQVSITRGAGEPFDSAARTFASALEFRPAQQDGVAIAAVIPFTVMFEPPAPAAPVPAPPPPAAAEPPPLMGSVELDVRGAPPVAEPTRRALAPDEVRTIPGTNGDVLRSVETLPGVARSSGIDGILVVRGAAPNDTQVFVDGTTIPLAYHFGGITSVVPGDVLTRLDFYPGNFGPQYGRGMGGIIDVGLRSPRRDRLGGRVQLDAIDGRVLIETPLGARTRVLLAARRSWVDAWFGPLVDGAHLAVRSAPVYWDGQLILEHDVGERSRLRLSLFGSDDRLSLLIKSPDPKDPSRGGSQSMATRFLRTQLQFESELSERTRLTSMLSWGYTDAGAQLSDDYFRYGQHEITLRTHVRSRWTPWLTWIGGVDAAYSRFAVDIKLPPYPGENSAPNPVFARQAQVIQTTAHLVRPALYTGLELTPTAALKLLPSLRADYTGDTGRITLDPRLSARWDLSPEPRRTTLKGGVGLFHQPPQPQESVDYVGNAHIRSSSALHTSLGIEQVLAPGLEASVEGFYKWLDDLIVAQPDESRLIGARFENSGSGRIYGAELSLRYKPATGPLSGFIAYTLSRSLRRQSPSAPEYVFDWDQTHILSAVASLNLGRGWSFGGRFRYVTGNPYTAYEAGLVDLDAGAYAAVPGARRNTSRMGAFHQLDLRLEKLWQFELWRLSAYLEVRNVYNRANPEAVTYNYDYSQRKAVAGLPILPVLGLRGEL